MKRKREPWASFLEASYPGHIAPASLKHHMIEAFKAALIGYPGHIAPASLKLFRRLYAFMFLSGYPGHIAPASLKRALLGLKM